MGKKMHEISGRYIWGYPVRGFEGRRMRCWWLSFAFEIWLHGGCKQGTYCYGGDDSIKALTFNLG